MSNSDKNKRGNSLKRVLIYMMRLCEELGYIDSFEEDYKRGLPGYTDQNQFKAPYKITFSDHTEWLIFSTTSLRDRIKEQYWDTLHLKAINPNISEAYLVYPDGLEPTDKQSFVSKNNKIQNNGEFSPLTALMSQESFFNRIEAYALRTLTPAQQRDRKGNNFEKRIASILSNPCNFEKWKTDDSILEGLHYSTFEEIITKLGLDRTEVANITATSDKAIIGYLPSGGPVKTDVLVTVTNEDATEHHYTISCKRTNQSSVSVHQYSADTFADVLSPTDTEFRRVLNCFQTCGNKRDMVPADALLLENKLQPLILDLCRWALGGIGGEGNPDTQWANYILAYDNNTESIAIHTTDEYCSILADDCTRAFNTPFSWSYQGTRGTNIQLSCPIFL